MHGVSARRGCDGNLPRNDYWPPGLRTGDPSDYTLDNFIKAYSRVGFQKCVNGDYEIGFQKIAIYSEAGFGEEWPQHNSKANTIWAWVAE